MGRKILLRIRGSRLDRDGKSKTMELITEGHLSEKDGIYYIEYEESRISGMEGVKNLISVREDKVSMQRSGSRPDRFLFEQGKKYMSSYQTSCGALQMGIYPIEVTHEMGENQGQVDLKYQLDIGGRHTGTGELELFYS